MRNNRATTGRLLTLLWNAVTRAYLCLLDAPALVEFLPRRGLYPDWILGVQAQPFGAHRRVQAQGQLLNEEIEYASQFTGIMSV